MIFYILSFWLNSLYCNKELLVNFVWLKLIVYKETIFYQMDVSQAIFILWYNVTIILMHLFIDVS